MRISSLANAILLALCVLSLLACGGGGGANVRPDTPATPPAPVSCQDPDARNFGQSGACVPRYRGAEDNSLVPTRVDRAREMGFTGAGVRVGFLDGAPRPDLPGYATYADRHTDHGDRFLASDFRAMAPSEHGHTVAQFIVGAPGQGFSGGVAPGATLEWITYCVNDQADQRGRCGGDAAGAYAFLADRGVTIVNHSFGAQGRFWEDSPEVQDAQARWARRTFAGAVERDMLLLFSGGNRQEASVNSVGATPYFVPEYSGNFIVVVGVDIGSDGRPMTTSFGGPPASQCVVAADWCLAAPIRNPYSGGVAWGTSSSVAVVSGIAALVSEAFPWMRGRNLQTTLLTTATSLGDPAVYGWGMVNAERAVRGPAQFLAGGFNANVDREGTWTFANDISGEGGLTVRGIGGLRLSGDNTYAGLTDIRGGHLLLSGRISGNVFNAGTFTSEGGRVGGNYQATANSTTQIEVGRGLEVGGTAILAGTLRLLAPTLTDYQVRDEERVLWASALNGRFANVGVGSGFFYSAELSYSDTDVIARLTRTSAAAKARELGAAANAVAGAERMDALLDHLLAGNGDAALRSAAFSIVGSQDEASALSSLSSLSGEVHGTVRSLAIEQAQGDAAVLADRAFGLRHVDGSAAWAQVVGRTGSVESDGYADADLSSAGLIVGADVPVSDSVKIGGSLSRSRASGELEGLAGELEARRTGVGVYALAQGDRSYASVTVGYDRMSVDTERGINLGGTGIETVTAARTDRVLHGRIEAGMEVGNGFIPYAAFGGLRHRQGSFAEQGAGGLGLAAASDTHTTRYGEAGVRFDRATANGGVWGGLLAGRWALSGRDAGYTATFAGAGDAVSFTTDGQRLAGGGLRVGVSYLSPERNGWQWTAEAVGEANGDGLRDGRLGLGVRYNF